MKTKRFSTGRFCLSLLLTAICGATAFAQQTSADFYNLGNEQFKKRELDAAVASYSECIRLNANANGCYQNRALALVEKSRREPLTADSYTKYDGVSVINKTRQAALADVNRALELNPKAGTAYFVRATIYSLEDIQEKAYEDFRHGLTLAPDVQAAKVELAKTEKKYAASLATRGRDAAVRASYLAQAKNEVGAAKVYQEAIDLFNKSLALEKSDYLTWVSRGNVYRYQKNYDAAVADYTEAIRLKPDYLDSYTYRAEAYAKQNKPALALADYEKLIAMPPDASNKFRISQALVGRGKISLDGGKTDAAIADFDKVLADQPNYVMAYFYRGQAYAKKKNKQQAVADFRKALEIAPDYADAKTELKKLGAN